MTSKNSKTPSDKTAARPDLRRLTEHLGVSQTTISRVLNGSAKNYRISEETQQRVLAAAAKLNYKANALARSLRSNHSKTVGVMVPEVSEGYSERGHEQSAAHYRATALAGNASRRRQHAAANDKQRKAGMAETSHARAPDVC